MHTGIETDVENALKTYAFSYPIISDDHINEMIKIQALVPLAKAAIPPDGMFEAEVINKDFRGFIDYLVPVDNKLKTFDLYDFKYSNNVLTYQASPQLHLYKYFIERENPGTKIRNMYLVFIPKISIKQKKDETLQRFRERLDEELKKAKIRTVPVEYDPEKVIQFLCRIKHIQEETEFPQNLGYFCRYCEYQEFCEKGWDYFMKLPENKRRNIENVTKRVVWIYGAPFCGKTTFANSFPDPLMLNTDGNIKFVDAPYVRIKDEVKVEGRMTKRTLAWEVFKDTISELEKKDNTFKTIVVDLLEDLYEHCRVYMYQQMGITHESDDSFRAWDKVRGEFLNTLKRLMNLDYENIILISHEDTSKDITKKGGDKITAIKPNLQDKVANKVAGMVDVVARIVADGDVRTFNFKSNEVIFGGGRLRVNAKDIPLDVNALFAVYDEANKGGVPAPTVSPAATRRKSKAVTSDKPQEASEKETVTTSTQEPEKAVDEPQETTTESTTQKETNDSAPDEGFMTPPEPAAEEKPRRRRKTRA